MLCCVVFSSFSVDTRCPSCWSVVIDSRSLDARAVPTRLERDGVASPVARLTGYSSPEIAFDNIGGGLVSSDCVFDCLLLFFRSFRFCFTLSALISFRMRVT